MCSMSTERYERGACSPTLRVLRAWLWWKDSRSLASNLLTICWGFHWATSRHKNRPTCMRIGAGCFQVLAQDCFWESPCQASLMRPFCRLIRWRPGRQLGSSGCSLELRGAGALNWGGVGAGPGGRWARGSACWARASGGRGGRVDENRAGAGRLVVGLRVGQRC